VIDELDGLKKSKDPHTRWRAAHTLAVLDLAGSDAWRPRSKSVLIYLSL
jgi:hypothetical protein